MKKLMLLITLFASVLFAQFKNPENEKKVEQEVLKEIKIIKEERLKGNPASDYYKQRKYSSIGLDNNYRILCRIRVKDLSVVSKITSLGGEIKQISHNDCYVWIPIEIVENISEIDGVLSIGSKGTAITRSNVISGGVSLHRTDLASSTFSSYGAGIKVGIISDGMNYWNSSSNNGDLPQYVYNVDNSNNTVNYPGSEGTAMMEIIHDIAPYAELWFGGINQNDNHLDFANRITHLKQNGCKIIVDDLGFTHGYSFFEENEITAAIKQFIQNNNGCYISAVGNEHGKMFSGTNYSVDTDKFIKFNSSTKELIFTSGANGKIRIFFQWADRWYSPIYDFDLFVFDSNNNLIFTRENRGSSFPPEEWGEFNANQGVNYKIKIKWYDYNVSMPIKEIKVLIMGDNVTLPLASSDKEVFGHVISDEVIGVAATDVSIHSSVESFSSRGPSLVFSSSSGTITSYQQPKITAADGVQTFIGQQGNFNNPFYGTSAAAPHIAGIAALYFSLNQTDSYDYFLNYLRQGATVFDGGTPQTWNNKAGFGLADAYNTIDLRMPAGVNIVQVDNTTGQSFGQAAVYYQGNWQYKNSNESIPLQPSNNWYFKASQDFKPNTYLKYNRWEIENTIVTNRLNHANIPITTGEEKLKAQFVPTYNAAIQNSIEGINSGNIEFKDPWLVDFTEITYGIRNRGTSALFKIRTSPFSADYTTSYNGDVYKGVFLGQGGNPYWIPPYYSVRAQSTQTINGYTAYFQNWSTTNAEVQNYFSLETPVVFTNPNAIVTANYKGKLISNSSAGFTTNSQRKVVRTTDNHLHLVYESMGKVWYTRSTDNGSNWSQEIPIDYLSNYSKNCSISSYGTSVYITYQSNEGDNPCIRLEKFIGGSLSWSNVVYTLSSYTYDTKPVVASYDNRVCVIYKPTSSSSLYAVKFQEDGTKGTNYQISNTDANSQNPTIVTTNQKFAIAYQNSTTEIRYEELSIDLNSTSVFDYQKISTGSPYTNNTCPSISAFGSGPIVSWSGYSTGIPSAVIKRRVNGTWSGFNSFGNGNVRSTNNNSISNGEESSIVAWCDIYYSYRFVKLANGSFSSILTLPESGGNGEIQIGNGNGFADLKAVVYKLPTSSIYPIKPLSYNFQTLQKINNDDYMNYGRTAVIQKDKNNYVYYLGGVMIDKKKVRFRDYVDTLEIHNENEMDERMTSETFHLEKGSTLEFKNLSYIFEEETHKQVKNNNVSFSIEIVNQINEEKKNVLVVSNFDVGEITDFESAYKVTFSNVEEGDYYLIVKSKTNGEAKFYLNNVAYEDPKEMKKELNQEIIIELNRISESYLDECYPNPFNPATNISFTLKDGGKISLKVFDVLGKEVANLADGFYESGKHVATFNGSNLASGIYFTRLTTKNVVITKKMMLLK